MLAILLTVAKSSLGSCTKILVYNSGGLYMESNESVENRLHPQLWPLVKHCLANENLLLHGGLVNIKNLRSRYEKVLSFKVNN